MVTTRAERRLIMHDPCVHGGEPIIRGTRVPIRSIILALQDDYPGDLPAVAEEYRISLVAVEAALDYYDAHQAEIERIVEQRERAAYDH
jgi:uncharacterized protein (DUF433 family)